MVLGRTHSEAMGIHPGFEMGLLVVRGGARSVASLLRIVDLRGLSVVQSLDRLTTAAQLRGGEVQGVVVRRMPLDAEAWTFDRFSREFQVAEEDVQAVGELRPLSEFVTAIDPGLLFKMQVEGIVLEDQPVPGGFIPCYAGRNIGRDRSLASASRAVRSSAVAKTHQLEHGDALIRAVVGSSESLVVAELQEGDLPATFGSEVLRIRWKPGVTAPARELLCGYLSSRRCAAWLRANGMSMHLTSALLSRAMVPDPSPRVLEALESMKKSAEIYRRWAVEADTLREDLFAQSSIQRSVRTLLERRGQDEERLQAAQDSQTLEYRVRNYFPHPLALRYESVAQLPHGSQRLRETLELAEFLMTYIAVLGIIQLQGGRWAESEGLISYLRKTTRGGELSFDWGKKAAIVQEALAATAKAPDPLGLPVPGLLTLGVLSPEVWLEWAKAEKELRYIRNEESHLGTLPGPELVASSQKCAERLRLMFEGTAFLARLPFVLVEDYRCEPVDRTRTVGVSFLVGASAAFKKSRVKVDGESASPIAGFLSENGKLTSLFPWIVPKSCVQCKRNESFVFAIANSHEIKYVAMETGHSQQFPELRGLWERLLAGASAEGSGVAKANT